MKRSLLCAIALLLFAVGCSNDDMYVYDGGPVFNYDSTPVPKENLNWADLLGQWKVVDFRYTQTNGMGMRVFDIFSGSDLPDYIKSFSLHYTFNYSSYASLDSKPAYTGSAREFRRYPDYTEIVAPPQGRDYIEYAPIEWDFGWSVKGRTLRLDHEPDMTRLTGDEKTIDVISEWILGDDEMSAQEIRLFLNVYLKGDRKEWIVTELTHDKLVLHYREWSAQSIYSYVPNPSEMPKQWEHMWYILEKVAEEVDRN